MKVLILKLGEKAYTTSRITAYLSRKAMDIDTKAIKLAQDAEAIKNAESPDLEAVKGIMDQMSELNDAKSWFICQVYGEKFSIEDLEKELSNEEIDAEIQRITQSIYGVIEKNA